MSSTVDHVQFAGLPTDSSSVLQMLDEWDSLQAVTQECCEANQNTDEIIEDLDDESLTYLDGELIDEPDDYVFVDKDAQPVMDWE